MRERLGIIGDVHGSLEPLEEIARTALRLVDRLVFVGDYVNRGSDSAAVIDYLAKLEQAEPDTVFLEGHHDHAFRTCLDDGRLGAFLQLGGATTMKSYFGSRVPQDVWKGLVRAVPTEHREFLGSLRRFYDGEAGLVVVHELTRDIRSQFEGERYVIAGHSPQPDFSPTLEPTHALIDTGCGTLPNGRLTCLLWPSLDWFQSEE